MDWYAAYVGRGEPCYECNYGHEMDAARAHPAHRLRAVCTPRDPCGRRRHDRRALARGEDDALPPLPVEGRARHGIPASPARVLACLAGGGRAAQAAAGQKPARGLRRAGSVVSAAGLRRLSGHQDRARGRGAGPSAARGRGRALRRGPRLRAPACRAGRLARSRGDRAPVAPADPGVRGRRLRWRRRRRAAG
jgi:hypothetical protein